MRELHLVAPATRRDGEGGGETREGGVPEHTRAREMRGARVRIQSESPGKIGHIVLTGMGGFVGAPASGTTKFSHLN